MKQKVTVFGSFVVDLMARTPHLPAPAETVKGSFFKQGAGGKGFNQGVAAHKAGGDVAMITKLGRDSMANVALDVMTELNMPKDFLLCNGNSISFFEPDGATFVKLFDTIGNYDIFGVLPVLACIWIVVAVIAFLVLRYTVFGRDLFVIGSGIEVARLSGIKVRKTFYLVYSLAGFVYGIAAIMFAGRILRAMPNTGDGYDMDAIAAAVIGGASLAGGRGAITGTFVGTLLMVVIKNAGKAFQINDYILDVITGALIIFAVAMDMVKSRKKA